MATPQDEEIALTHTGLRDRKKRLWSFNGFALPGLSLHGLGAAAVFTFIMMTVTVIGYAVLNSVIVMTVGVLTTVIGAPSTYWLWGSKVTAVGGIKDTVLMWLDYRLLQPRTIHGSGADKQPTHLAWQVILWVPTDEGWIARRDATYQWLIRNAPDGTAIAAARSGTSPTSTP